MKEIDFLPRWYTSGRRREINYRAQYVIIVGVFVIGVVWSFFAAHSISKVKAELEAAKAKRSEAVKASVEFEKVKSQVTDLRKKLKILNEIDSRIDVASVLGEMSFLIDERIVLSKVTLTAERFVEEREAAVPRGGAKAVRPAGESFGSGEAAPVGKVRFKVVVYGVAPDGKDVAELVCKLEDSPYFCQVYPSFSRSSKIEAGDGTAAADYLVTEFEIGCYLANYEQGEGYFANNSLAGRVERR